MDINLVHTLQSCIDDCNRLINEAERDKERYKKCISGEMLKTTIQISNSSIEAIRKIRKQLYNLQQEEKLQP